jgi:hypothetical protein
MFNFEELDETTRKWMLLEFRIEEASGNPYRSPRLSPKWLEIFPQKMEEAIKHGNEETLTQMLSDPVFWNSFEYYTRSGVKRKRRINYQKAAEALSITEFNTWYVKGFAHRLLEEGEEYCEVYRAAPAFEPRGECLQHDGRTYEVQRIYDGHRTRYWPHPGNPSALSIPVGTNCHHSIRRVRR